MSNTVVVGIVVTPNEEMLIFHQVKIGVGDSIGLEGQYALDAFFWVDVRPLVMN